MTAPLGRSSIVSESRVVCFVCRSDHVLKSLLWQFECSVEASYFPGSVGVSCPELRVWRKRFWC